jgi:hypothetical protein
MKASRRDFIKASTAIGMAGITQTAAAAAAKAAAKAKIGFVVSTSDQPDHIRCFLRGLQDNQEWGTATKPIKFYWASANGKYGGGRKELYRHAMKHMVNHQVNMIVAAGGLASAIAVAQAVDKYAHDHGDQGIPFSYLIGRTPLANEAEGKALYQSAFKTGGVDQAIPAQNENNIMQLKEAFGAAVTPDTVGLIVNNNNPMTPREALAWQAQHQFLFQASRNTENDKQIAEVCSDVARALASDPKPNAIVVSSDPYFRSFGPEFESQLRDPSGGNFAGYVCYPYQEYQDPPTDNSIVSKYTPKLSADVFTDDDTTIVKTAYYQLGFNTANVLQALSDNPGTFPTVPPKVWNGTTWV